MRISAMSVSKKRFKTELPKEPVPPVIMRVFPANIDMWVGIYGLLVLR